MTSNQNIKNIKNLIVNHQRRLQILKEQKALYGLSADPKILIEIQDIENKLESLQKELKELQTRETEKVNEGFKKIKFSIQAGNVTTYKADVLALKFAQALYGADKTVAHALGKSQSQIAGMLHNEGQYKIFFANGRIKAKQVLFVSVIDLYRFGYEDIRRFSGTVLEILANSAPRIKHLAMTIHGVGYGLDEAEALRSQLAGYLDAFDKNDYPPSLEQVTIVERDRYRVERLRDVLSSAIPENAVLVPKMMVSVTEPKTVTRSPSVTNVGRQSDTKPHILVAIPSTEGMEDVYYYGIQSVVNNAGYLCERLDSNISSNEILERVKARIETASFIIAELTEPTPNILLELGYAWGKGRPTIILTKDKKKITFGADGQRCLIYNRIRDLEESLTKELQLLSL